MLIVLLILLIRVQMHLGNTQRLRRAYADDGHADVLVLAVGNGQGDLANPRILEDMLRAFAGRLRTIAEIPGKIRLGDRRAAPVERDRLAGHHRRGQR